MSIIEKCFMEITDVYAEKLLWPSIYMDEENGYDPEEDLSAKVGPGDLYLHYGPCRLCCRHSFYTFPEAHVAVALS